MDLTSPRAHGRPVRLVTPTSPLRLLLPWAALVFVLLLAWYFRDLLTLLMVAAAMAYVVVPLGDGRKYYVPSYEMDVTHKIRQPLDWWVRVFNNAGFHVDFADYRHGHIKENWVSTPNGNGFFILS
jgi:Zn-dependent protease with chaperone function